MRRPMIVVTGCLFATALFASLELSNQEALAGGCTPSTGPDVIVGNLEGWGKWGAVGSVAGYTVGTNSCNIGDQVLPWIANSNSHPVIGQNVYRLKNGRFEQIGMSWVKHGWGASSDNLCCTC